MKQKLLYISAPLILFGVSGCSNKEKALKPNIVFILLDDMGVEVVGSYGGQSYNTPNIDELAQSGIQFTQCYSAPVSSPSRVKLLTGRYGFRTGQTWGHLPDSEITFGHILQDAGYKTGLSGKWQMTLLKDNPDHIAEMGFEESCVFGWHEGPRYWQPMIYHNGKVRDDVQDKYGPDVFSEHIINFIKKNKDKPFFAYYPMTLAHEISNDFDTPPPVGPKGRYETYKENIEYADSLIGVLVKTLNDLQIRENTIIIFSGDNGTPYKYITSYENREYIKVPIYSEINDTLIRGGKSFLTDAGTHVPLIINWKGISPQGTVNDDLIDFSDFMPTFAELTGAKLPEDRQLDGRSFASQIIGEKGNPRDWVYQLWEGKGWIRNKQWKLYLNGNLFNMQNDPFEKQPILPENDNTESKEIRNYFENELQNLHKKH